jgi:hypothetical protein
MRESGHVACARLAQYQESQIYHEFLKLSVVLDVLVQIHVSAVFALHTRSRMFTTTTKLTFIGRKSSLSSPCFTQWIASKVLQILVATDGLPHFLEAH